MNWAFFLTAWLGCPTSGDSVAPEDAPKEAQAKQGKGRKGGKAKRGKAKRPGPAPIGVAGTMDVALKLETTESEEEGGGPMTKAILSLTWAEGGAHDIEFGPVKGTCTEVEPRAVGPEGRQKMPLWTLHCDGDVGGDIFILQAGPNLNVIRQVEPGVEGGAPRYRPVKRVPLVHQATLQKKGT